MLHVWLTLAVAVGVGWLFCHVVLREILGSRIVLSSGSYDGPPQNAPKVSVVLAAKDEEGDIEPCVTALLDQDYPDYELIVVDDRSRDQTPFILKRLQRRVDDRLRLLTVKDLPGGWSGKNNAMREGVAASCGQWLLFTDADCRASRKALSMAMCEALHKDVDFLSIAPVLEARKVWEHVLQPTCAAVLMSWFLPHRVNHPQKSTAYANGAFMLMRRTCYEVTGGHERVRSQLNEDVGLARLAKQRGLRLRLVENGDLYHVRMYGTLVAAWHGWSRIFYGCLQSLPRLLATCGLLILFCIGPWVGLLVAVAGRHLAAAETTAMWSTVAGAWAGVLVIEQLAWWRVFRLLQMQPAWSLTYPIGVLAALGMLIHAMLKAVGATTTTWRGTTYRQEGRWASHPRVCPTRGS